MKDIDQFLRDNVPETPGEGQFLIETNARLDAVEGIKATVDGEHRRWRKALFAALVTGLVLGCLVTALVLLWPEQAGESALTKAVEALQGVRYVLFGLIACCALALGLLSLSKRREEAL